MRRSFSPTRRLHNILGPDSNHETAAVDHATLLSPQHPQPHHHPARRRTEIDFYTLRYPGVACFRAQLQGLWVAFAFALHCIAEFATAWRFCSGCLLCGFACFTSATSCTRNMIFNCARLLDRHRRTLLHGLDWTGLDWTGLVSRIGNAIAIARLSRAVCSLNTDLRSFVFSCSLPI